MSRSPSRAAGCPCRESERRTSMETLCRGGYPFQLQSAKRIGTGTGFSLAGSERSGRLRYGSFDRRFERPQTRGPDLTRLLGISEPKRAKFSEKRKASACACFRYLSGSAQVASGRSMAESTSGQDRGIRRPKNGSSSESVSVREPFQTARTMARVACRGIRRPSP